MRAKFGSDPTAGSKILSFKFISRLYYLRFLLLPCVTKIILTEKLFGVGSSNFGFVHLDNFSTSSSDPVQGSVSLPHYRTSLLSNTLKNIEQDPRTKCVGNS